MSRILYIHIGPMKTGTSALQNLLREHDNSAIVYPKVGLWGPGSHHGLVSSFFGDTLRGKQPHAPPEHLFQEIAASVRSTERNLLISSEMFALPPGRKKSRDLTAFVGSLLKHLDGDWRVEILFTCRDHLQRAASVYSQRVKGKESREQHGPDEFLVQHIDDLLYAPLATAVREVGFRLAALNYHPAESWTTRFLSYVGFRADQIPQPQLKNVSLSVKALIAKLSANRTLQSVDERHHFLKLLKDMPGYFAPSQFIFGREAVAQAEQPFLHDRSFLQREFGIELPDADRTGRESMFFLNSETLEEIGVIAREMGASGTAIVDVARKYLRKH